MNGIKLIALDLDGTLLHRHEISEANRRAIAEARAHGVAVTIATGREVHSMKRYWKELKLDAPFITVNGGEVWSASGELHSRHSLSEETAVKLYDIAVGEKCSFWCDTTEGPLHMDNWKFVAGETVCLKFGFETENAKQLERIRTKVTELGMFELTNSHPANLEVNPKGISKASGIRQICSLLSLSMEQVLAVGDSLNDKTMLIEAGIGVAMGNAQDELKSVADAVTGRNNEDGVAQAIRRYVLE